MKKFVFLFSIISFCILSGFIDSDVVLADDFSFYKNPGSVSFSATFTGEGYGYDNYNISGSPGVYFLNYSESVGSLYTDYDYRFTFVFFDIDKTPVYSNYYNNGYTSSSSYQKIVDGVSHTIYYTSISDCSFFSRVYFDPSNDVNKITYSHNIIGTRIYPDFSLNNSDGIQRVCNFFLFGEGSLDYEMPVQDIPDSDLDIVGLSCYLLNDQTGSVDYYESSKNLMMNFYSAVLETFFDVTKSMEETALDPSLLQGSIVNYVPGVALAWNSPPLDPDISYSVWVDGISKINYKTSLDPISNFLNTQQIDSCAYSKLQINDSPLVQSGSVYYQYNTNQGLQYILEFIENNSSLNPPANVHSWNRYSYVSLETTISRVYIQASKVIDGERHYGAISYVDIVDGQPTVHEGVTDSITDILPSDPETSGTTTTVGTTMVTSGDTIYTGDTITNNNEYNYNYGTGLIVGTTNPLGFIKSLFSAIFELIQSLYLAFLVPFILLGMTGSTGGIL